MRHKMFVSLLTALLLALVLSGIATAQDEVNVAAYTVREGNTLVQIAEFFDVDVECLAEANVLEVDGELEPGTVLVISSICTPYTPVTTATPETAGQGGGAATTQPAAPPAPAGQGGGGTRLAVNGTYLVQRGDRLGLIARDNGVSLICLVVANQIFNPDLIYVGQTIRVPNDCAPYEQGGGSPIPGQPGAGVPGGGRVYTVQTQLGPKSYVLQADGSYIVRPTDILDFIALGFNVNTQCLAAANQIVNSYRLQPGQRLFIDFGCPPWSGVPGPRPGPYYGPAGSGQGGGPVG